MVCFQMKLSLCPVEINMVYIHHQKAEFTKLQHERKVFLFLLGNNCINIFLFQGVLK